MSDLTNLYQCESFEQALESAIETAGGEVTDEQMEALVEVHTQSIEQTSKLVRGLLWIDRYMEAGKAEIERIQKLIDQKQKAKQGIRRYLTPYVDRQVRKHKRPLDIGHARLSVRRSQKVEITDPDAFREGRYPDVSTKKTTWTPDKKAIKELLAGGDEHPAATLVDSVNLQIK